MVFLRVFFCLFSGRNLSSLAVVKYPAELDAQNSKSQPVIEDS